MPAKTPAEEAWELLWKIMQANKQRVMELARELDFSPVQLHSLRLLEPEAETPMRALAQQLFCDPSNVTGIVDRLEARGLIERVGSERDRRVKIIRLTPEGRRVRAGVVERMSSPPARDRRPARRSGAGPSRRVERRGRASRRGAALLAGGPARARYSCLKASGPGTVAGSPDSAIGSPAVADS
jgi:DNA-binding MarR family transcriptional regulator